MNHAYRIVWNQARNCFVAAAETTRARGKSAGRKTLMASAVALALSSGPLFAQVGDCPATISSDPTTPCALHDAASSTITSAGAVRNDASGFGVYVSSDTGVSLTNNGTITAGSVNNITSATGVRVNGNLVGTVTNNGHIAAAAGGFSGSANAWGVMIGNELTGTLNNSGSIAATVENVYEAHAYGVYETAPGVPMTGAVSNSGQISANATGQALAEAYGLYFGADLAGSLSNTGGINAVAHSLAPNSGWPAPTANAYGIYVGGNLTGQVTNSGTISASGTAEYATGYGYGVYVAGDLSGRLTNSGTITAFGTDVDHATSATAYGVYANNLSGSLVNSGTITAEGNGSYVQAAGVRVQNSLANLENTGTIRATADAYDVDHPTGSSANAYGIEALNLTGTLTNSGTIAAVATGHLVDDVRAYGVSIWQTAHDITNSGSISADASAVGNITADAYGIYMNALSGTLSNSGTVSASAMVDGTAPAYAYGVFLRGNLTTAITNAAGASITAFADPVAAAAIASGIYGGGDVSAGGTITNDGTVSATATGSHAGSSDARAVHIHGSLNGTLTNGSTGRITASATNTGSGAAAAYGVYVGSNISGTLINAGTISASGNGTVWSLYAAGGSGTVNNLAGGLLDGAISVSGAVTVNNAGTLNTGLGASSVAGNFNQSASGVLRIGATSAANFGKLTVGGTATLSDGTGLRVVAAAGHTLGAGDILAGVVNAATLNKQGTVFVTDNIMGLNFNAALNAGNANQLDLTAAATGFNSVLGAVQGAGRYQFSAAAAMLDGLLPNADNLSQPLRDYLYALGGAATQQDAAKLVAQIVPLLNAGASGVIGDLLHGSNGAVLSRLDGLRGLSSGDPVMGDRHFWVKPFASRANQSDRGATGYSADTAGLVVGADAELKPGLRVGAAFGYAHSNVDGNSATAPNSAGISAYQAILYGNKSLDERTGLDFQADIGQHDVSGQRNILSVGSVAQAGYQAWSGHLGVGVSHSHATSENTTWVPSLRADYTRIKSDGYTETGAGALNLTVEGNTAEEFILSADGRVEHKFSPTGVVSAHLGVGYDLIGQNKSITAALAGSPSALFATQGIENERWSLRAGLGVSNTLNTGTEITARYDVEFKEGYTNQTASVRVKVPF